ncbi:hypothetical protein DERF_004795 [Dermatophagoides farinae]|uniref:Uncharacterized protein n=1 Tax=Dermatophagoides farinae TaxID=6954 RepID=A0A922I278_DERFA|nr:hypothetical protein DERF_004795 [Dermatophagoides farinae]
MKKLRTEAKQKKNHRAKVIVIIIIFSQNEFNFDRTKRKHQKSKQQQQHSYKNEGIRRPKKKISLQSFQKKQENFLSQLICRRLTFSAAGFSFCIRHPFIRIRNDCSICFVSLVEHEQLFIF